MKRKTLILFCLTILMAAALMLAGGCGNGGGSADQPDFIYLADYYDLPDEIDYMSNACVHGDTIYFYSNYKTGVRTPEEGEPQPGDEEYYEGMYDEYSYGLFKINIDGSGYQQLAAFEPLTLPETDMEISYNLNSLSVDDMGRLWVCENISTYTIDEQGWWQEGENSFWLRQLDDNGAELSRVDLTALRSEDAEDYFYIGSMNIDAAGNLYLTSDMTIFVLDPQGQLMFRIDSDRYMDRMMRLTDGSMAVATWGETGMELLPIDLNTKALGTAAVKLPANAYNIIGGGGEYALYYNDGNDLYGFDPDTAASTRLVNWIDSDIDSDNVQQILPLDDGRIVFNSTVWDRFTYESTSQLAVLTKHDRADVPQKTVLTMAALYLDYNVRAAVLDFNKTNPDYRISVTDYSIYNNEGDYNAGLTKLSTDIITGKMPDILCTGTELPFRQYAAKGLLEDLYPYLDSDTELSRDSLWLLQAMETGGKLYNIAPSFHLTTAMGSTDVVGDLEGWNMGDLLALMAKHPEAQAFAGVTRDSMLQYLCAMDMDNYVDWDNGQVHFDTQNFIDMLEFAKTCPAEYNYDEDAESEVELIRSGKVLLYPIGLGSFDENQLYEAIFPGEVTYVGFPSEDGHGHVANISSGLAMSSKCSNKEAAWTFMRGILTKDYQRVNVGYGFPTNKDAFQYQVTRAMATEDYIDEYGQKVEVYTGGGMGMDGVEVEVHPLTQAELDRFIHLINSTTKTVNYDQNIFTIIQEEAAAFFAGNKTAAETANLIQNRVGTYVSEQS